MNITKNNEMNITKNNEEERERKIEKKIDT